MKNKFIWLGLSFLMVAAMLLASCGTKSTTTKTTSITTTTKTTTTTANWWDSLGTPTYGGIITIQSPSDFTAWDPYSSPGSYSITDLYMDHLTADNWTVNPATYPYQMDWRPPEFVAGNLAASYEYTSPNTIVYHLRQGIHYQNIPPANGRELVASDVVANYQRMFGAGTGSGSPYYSWYVQWKQLQSVTATDNYTVAFKWAVSNTEFINELMDGASGFNSIPCPDAVAQWGNLDDWHHAIGTGPLMLTDFIAGSSATLVRNPNYWAHDERYPQNQLPYVNGVTVLIVPDAATALAAMRTGKIDIMYGMTNAQATQMKTSNPNIVQIPIVGMGSNLDISMRNDKAPFTDIRVREALQMSINLSDIAKNYYGGNCSPDPSTLTNNNLVGWGFPYSEWPQDLKDQYAYNPTQAKALLTAAGFSNGFDTDCVAENDWDMDLLQIVKSYFAAINVNMTIRVMDVSAWVKYVRGSHSNDAMAYGSNHLALSYEPSMMFGSFQTGASGNLAVVSDPVFDDFYNKALTATTLDDFKQILTAANQRVAEQHYEISLPDSNIFAFCQPWLKGYNGQSFAADFAAEAPMYGGFYLARFWVDSTLKTSMGY